MSKPPTNFRTVLQQAKKRTPIKTWPTFSRQHFECIAKVIEALPSTIHPQTPLRYVVAAAFAKMLHADNPDFNAERFLCACVATDRSDIPADGSTAGATDSKEE